MRIIESEKRDRVRKRTRLRRSWKECNSAYRRWVEIPSQDDVQSNG